MRPNVQAAGRILRKAIERGLIPPIGDDAECTDGCGRKARVYDHRDYAEPLVVEPVCYPCNYRRGAAANRTADLRARYRDIVQSLPTLKECRKMAQAPAAAAIAVRNIPVEHLEMLAAGARRDGITREELVRRLIAEWVKENCEPAT